MTWLPDSAVVRLRQAASTPDFSGTRYRLVEEIGRGGMGTVYAADDVELSRRVAVKVLNAGEVSRDVAARMSDEARVLAHLEHPGIVPVYDAGVLADGRAFYAMKLVRGRRLDEYARGAGQAELLRVFEKVCEAVAFAHSQGVIHRDLKPQNIMVGAFGEVLVMDWGVARWRERARATGQPPEPIQRDGAAAAGTTAHGTVIGTPGFMAPEQARGDARAADERSDVYALGAILRFVLAAANTGDGESAPPKILRAICSRATADDPGARYAGAMELAADVARFSAGQPVGAYRENLLERAARVASRHQMLVILIMTYLLARVLFLFLAGR